MSIYSLQSVLGLGVLVTIGWSLSENRRSVSLRQVATGIALQIAIALFMLKVPVAQQALLALNGAVEGLTRATLAGTSFVFGYVGGGLTPFEIKSPEHLFIFGFQALPLVLVMSALSAVLWHWRILPAVTRFMSLLLQKSMGINGAVGLASAATIFVGMVEAPLLIRPYLARLTRAEMFIMMTVGMAAVSGTVLVIYASILEPVVHGALGQILVASLISLPSSITIARLMVPESDVNAGTELEKGDSLIQYESSMDALTRGTMDGLQLLLNIIAMLIVAVALVALVNILLALLPDVSGAPLSLQRMLGWFFAPLVWLMGVPSGEVLTAGQLMGTKTILNEMIAYINLSQLPAGALSPRSALIMVYAMCGFANLGSVGILIGGLTSLAPSRRSDIIELGTRAIISGTLATSMTGAVIGLVTS